MLNRPRIVRYTLVASAWGPVVVPVFEHDERQVPLSVYALSHSGHMPETPHGEHPTNSAHARSAVAGVPTLVSHEVARRLKL